MKTFCVVLGIMFVQALLAPLLSAQHYYSNSQQVPLGVDSLKVCLKFDDLVSQQDQARCPTACGGISNRLQS